MRHVAVLMGGWSAEREVSLVSGEAAVEALRAARLPGQRDRRRPRPARHGSPSCVPTWSSTRCTAAAARTAPSRACSRSWASPTAIPGVLASSPGDEQGDGQAPVRERRPALPRGPPHHGRGAAQRRAAAADRPTWSSPTRKARASGSGSCAIRASRRSIATTGRTAARCWSSATSRAASSRSACSATGRSRSPRSVHAHGFFDYHAKYTANEAQHLIPAPLPPELYQRALDQALRAHRAARLPRRDPLRLPPRPGRSRRPLPARAQHPAGHDADLPGAGAGGPCRHRLRRPGRSSWSRRRDATHDARRPPGAQSTCGGRRGRAGGGRRSCGGSLALGALPGRRARLLARQRGRRGARRQRAHRPPPGADRQSGFAVREVYVDGRVRTDPEALRSQLGIAVGQPILDDRSPRATRARLEQLTWVERASVERMLPDQRPGPPDRAPAAGALATGRPLRPDRPRRRGDRRSRARRHGRGPGRCRSGGRSAIRWGQLRVLVGDERAAPRRAGCSRCSRPSRSCGRGWSPRPGSASGAGRSTSTTGSTCCCRSRTCCGAWRLLAPKAREDALLERAISVIDLRFLPTRLRLRLDPEALQDTKRMKSDNVVAAAIAASRGRSAGTSRSACSTSARPRCAA